MFAGQHAAGFKRAKREGRVFMGFFDGLPRFRIDDGVSCFKPEFSEFLAKAMAATEETTFGTTLGHALNHAKLFRNYPELYNAELKLTLNIIPNNEDYIGPIKPKIGASAGPNLSIEVRASLGITPKRIHSSILHETQHQIQMVEGFARGHSPSAIFKQVIHGLSQEWRQTETSDLLAHLQGQAAPPPATKRQEAASHMWDYLGSLLPLLRKRELSYQDRCLIQSVGSHHFYRLSDLAYAAYRATPGEIEARQVQYEFMNCAAIEPGQHITITSRPCVTARANSLRGSLHRPNAPQSALRRTGLRTRGRVGRMLDQLGSPL
jgi:hypothetical protein